MLATSLVVLAQAFTASALVAKRQEGPLVYKQGEFLQAGAVEGSSFFTGKALGCFNDNYPQYRTLNGTFFNEPVYTTVNTCNQYCAERGYLFAGVEYGTQCMCGNGLKGEEPVDSSLCNMPCQADNSQTCGGANVLSITELSMIYQSGCFADQVNYRSLTGASYSSNDMTVESCATFCKAGDFSLAGVEYGNECHCGNQLRIGTSNNCNVKCAGDSTEICGGGNALSVFGIKGSTIISKNSVAQDLGCFSDFYPDHRTLDGPSIVVQDLTNMMCQSYCTAQGYPYSGTEFGAECFCGKTAPTVSSDKCTVACTGDPTSVCGGDNALNIMYYGAAVKQVSTSEVAAVDPSTVEYTKDEAATPK